MTPAGKKKLILPLLIIMGILALGIGMFFFTGPMMAPDGTVKDVHIDSEAIIKLGLMEQVSKKNGITEWELKADTATVLKKEDKAVLTNVTVIFYTENQKTITLTADEGELNTKTHDMSFLNHVVVQYAPYTLRTDKLHYKKKPHIIHSDVRVRLEDTESWIEADTLRMELKTNQMILQGNVEGTFSENFKLK